MVLLPTENWKKRMQSGDDVFTPAMIDATESVLREFLTEVRSGAPMDAVRKVVQKLNAIGGFDGKMGNFIDTTEREELCALINQQAQDAGATGPQDFTEEWREW